MRIWHDATGSPVGLEYMDADISTSEWHSFRFEKNIFGDVVAIYNSSGQKVISYIYDAWGNFYNTFNEAGVTDAEFNIANYNPFTYRGYYHDRDLNLYYLQSRYYDAQVGRFINADTTAVLTATPNALTDKNLFAYCDNNPVMRVDEEGTIWWWAVGAVMGGLISGAVEYAKSQDPAKVATAVIFGAVSGAIGGCELGVVKGFLIDVALDMGSEFVMQTIDIVKGEENGYNGKDFAAQLGISIAVGAGSQSIGKVTKSITDHLSARNMNNCFDALFDSRNATTLKKYLSKTRKARMYLSKSIEYDRLGDYSGFCVGLVESLTKIVLRADYDYRTNGR